MLKGRAEASGRSIAEVTDEAMAIQSLQRFVDPADIAQLAVLLASDAGRSITGQTIVIDNGSQTAVTGPIRAASSGVTEQALRADR